MVLLVGTGVCIAMIALLLLQQNLVSQPVHAQQKLTNLPQSSDGTPDWLARPSFAGKVLHWTQTVYSYTSGGTDPANGRAVNGDIWVKVGSDGIPTFIHARYTLADGTVLQEFTQTQTTTTFHFSAAYHRANSCTIDNQADSTGNLLSALPLFVKESLLPSNGYVPAQKVIQHPYPLTPSLAGATPLQTYSSGASVHPWLSSEQLNSGMKHTYAIDVNTDGRVVATEVHLFDAKGVLVQDNWHTYGQLQVYSNISVPKSATTFLDQKGGCNA